MNALTSVLLFYYIETNIKVFALVCFIVLQNMAELLNMAVIPSHVSDSSSDIESRDNMAFQYDQKPDFLSKNTLKENVR